MTKEKIVELFVANWSRCFSKEDKEALQLLEDKKVEILNIEAKYWHIKSRAIWIKQRNWNSKFFHKYSKHRKIVNSIWDLKYSNELVISSQIDLKKEVVRHFENIFKSFGCNNVGAYTRVIQHYPMFLMRRKDYKWGRGSHWVK